MKKRKESNKAVRERMRKWRASKKPVTQTVTHSVTQEDIDNLPLSLKMGLDAVTRARKVLKMPDNLKDRQEAAVRGFRGH